MPSSLTISRLKQILIIQYMGLGFFCLDPVCFFEYRNVKKGVWRIQVHLWLWSGGLGMHDGRTQLLRRGNAVHPLSGRGRWRFTPHSLRLKGREQSKWCGYDRNRRNCRCISNRVGRKWILLTGGNTMEIDWEKVDRFHSLLSREERRQGNVWKGARRGLFLYGVNLLCKGYICVGEGDGGICIMTQRCRISGTLLQVSFVLAVFTHNTKRRQLTFHTEFSTL